MCYGTPIVTLGIGSLIMICYFREDAIVYLIKNNRRSEAINFIGKVYQQQNGEDFGMVYDYIKSNIKIEDN